MAPPPCKVGLTVHFVEDHMLSEPTGTTVEEIVWYSHHAIVCSWPSGLRNVAAKVKIQVSELCGMQTRVHQILT